MKIAITGDLFVEHPETIKVDDKIKQLMAGCDFRIVNLEGPITTTAEKEAPLKSGPRLKQPEGVVRILEELKFNIVTLSNNHIMDYGEQGYKQTKIVLKEHCAVIGSGKWDEAYRLHIIEKDGIRVGILNFSEMQFGMLYDKRTQDNNSIGCAWINHPHADELITFSKKRVDKLIAICHCGLEMQEVPLPEWRDRYYHMVNCGCDAIIAHHPHIVQGYEIYKNAAIFYSLGNFCFVREGSSDAKDWNTGALAILNVKKDVVSLETKGVQTLDRNRLVAMSDDEWNCFITKRNELLKDDVYLKKVNEICLNLWDSYKNVFAMGGLFSADKQWLKHLARIIMKRYNAVHLLNNLQCESHRWCICRALRLNQSNIG